ncbi:MAG: hypothetical protein WBX27_05575 [Specibacter sp.]
MTVTAFSSPCPVEKFVRVSVNFSPTRRIVMVPAVAAPCDTKVPVHSVGRGVTVVGAAKGCAKTAELAGSTGVGSGAAAVHPVSAAANTTVAAVASFIVFMVPLIVETPKP